MAHPQDSERFKRLEHQKKLRDQLAAAERKSDAEKNAKIKDLLDNGPKHAAPKPKGKHRKKDK
jgi:hypothetical protein